MRVGIFLKCILCSRQRSILARVDVEDEPCVVVVVDVVRVVAL